MKTEMYVSYAKDIFIALLDSENLKADYEIATLMYQAIELIKQAEEAFKDED